MTGLSAARCGRCGTCFPHTDFALLPAVTQLDGDQLEDHVTQWPAGFVVDVRRCSTCGHTIARLASGDTRPRR